MPEVQPYIREFDAHIRANDPQISNERLEFLQKSEFKSWFKQKVEHDVNYELFKHLIDGPVLDDISDEEGDVTDISESDDEGDVAGATEGAGAETDDAEGDVEGEDSDTEGEDGESDGESEAEKGEGSAGEEED
ncbi:hypothetical protein POM88_015098 [Heracleum sosnowskyi]|uniref:Uncharacterized protein n=1 Tax=Heracleum sosnowskyi TaxID=360622 RepID=A0AAD8IN01_9APIA|nr:hypothetical protein POM88_029057 [Heracleum sosnowskyi]KAK1386920.1 hypothetical protein POM88_015098 [Heracleum sosnowskyi]